MLQLLFDFFGGKAKTRIYTTFLGWMLVLHIDILFIALFTDQDLIFKKANQLKGEYVWSYIVHFGWSSVAIEIGRLIVACGITYLMIWVIPKLMNARSYKEELEVEYALRKMKVNKEEALNKKEEVVVKKQLATIKKEKKVAVERAKLVETPEQVRWESEYDDFIKIPNARDTLQELSHTVYAEGGNLYQYKDVNGWATAPTGVKANNLALADTSDLVTFTDKGKVLTLTSKGKYFLKRLSNL